jgi:hypothetical protein
MMTWASHIENVGIDACNTVALKSEGKIQFGKPYLHMDNIEIDVIILAGVI